MWKFWRKRPEKSREIPVYPPGYAGETVAIQLRIMRTHIAAQASEIGNLRTALDVGLSLIRADLEHVTQQVKAEGKATRAGKLGIDQGRSGVFLG